MDLVLLGGLDSLAGAILGIVKTSFFLSLFLWLSLLFDLQMPKDWKNDSQYLGYIEPLAPSVIGILEPIFPKVKEVISNIEEIVEGFRDKSDLI